MPLIKLAVPKEVAWSRIRTQIGEGEEILSRCVRDSLAVEKFLEDQKGWSGFTSEVLRHSFTETEYCDDFSAEWSAATMYGSRETPEEKVAIASEATKAQLGVPRTIDRKVELLQELPASPEQEALATQILTGNGPKIFISHSGIDARAAEALANLFRAALSIPASSIRCTSALPYSLPFGVD